MGADAAKHAGQRETFHDQLDGLLIFSLTDELDITLNINTCRTCDYARCSILFVNSKGNGDCLGKGSVYGLSLHQSLIPFGWSGNRTDRATFSAARTDTFFHILWFTMNFYPVVADESRYLLYFAPGKKLNIRVLTN